ncbi:MAG: metallophosphoesterase [Planctomycetota bacterium]
MLRPLVVLLLIVSCVTSGCRFEEKTNWQGPFFFIQMADTQFGFFEKNESFARETELFEKAVSHANRLRPAFVVICGDIINKSGNERQKAEFFRICSKLNKGIPLYLVAGNHDISKKPGMEELMWYRKNFGKDWYSFGYGGCSFIVLNSTIIGSPEKVPEEENKQWQWLTEEFKKIDGRANVHTFIFLHHPLFLTGPNEEDRYFNIPGEQRSRCLKLFAENKVSTVFAGHYHRNSYGRYGDMEMVTTGPVSKPLGKDPSGFRIVKVFKDHIEHNYYGFESMPEAVELKVSNK